MTTQAYHAIKAAPFAVHVAHMLQGATVRREAYRWPCIGWHASYEPLKEYSIMQIINILTHDQLADLFLEYFNNYLTVEKFAEHYGLSQETAYVILAEGRTYHEERAA